MTALAPNKVSKFALLEMLAETTNIRPEVVQPKQLIPANFSDELLLAIAEYGLAVRRGHQLYQEQRATEEDIENTWAYADAMATLIGLFVHTVHNTPPVPGVIWGGDKTGNFEFDEAEIWHLIEQLHRTAFNEWVTRTSAITIAGPTETEYLRTSAILVTVPPFMPEQDFRAVLLAPGSPYDEDEVKEIWAGLQGSEAEVALPVAAVSH